MEDFTEFEQRAAYFDGDPVIATKKGSTFSNGVARCTSWLSFRSSWTSPQPPSLALYGKLNPNQRPPRLRSEGRNCSSAKRHCAGCHQRALLHGQSHAQPEGGALLQAADDQWTHGDADGPIKTFPLRGIKDSSPYFHDGRLLTLEDTVEFFNIVLGSQLTAEEKQDLVAFLLVL